MGLRNTKRRLAEKSTVSIIEEELNKLRGYIDYVLYPRGFIEADEMLWVSMIVKNPLTGSKMRVSGNTNHHSVGDYLEFYGHWGEYNHEPVFEFQYALRVDDDFVGATSMLAFLFGPRTAERIITAYDENPIEAMMKFKVDKDGFIDSMVRVKGVGPKKIEKAYEKHKKYISVERLYYKFCKFNFSLNKAMKLIKMWGIKANEIIDENVYYLINVDGFGFDTIDRIGLDYYKFDKTDGRRIEAYIIQTLKNATYNGDCFLYLEGSKGLIARCQIGLNIPDSLIREKVVDLITTHKIIHTEKSGQAIIYLPYIYEAEKNVARIISETVRKNRVVQESKIDSFIDEYEREKGFVLAKKQKDGIKTSSINQLSIISGPPGSGKTTLIDCICTIFKKSKKNCNIKLAALAGKAATRMSEATGLEASTIHRLLGYNPDTGFKYNSHHPIPNCDLLIVDEFSMVDIVLFERLLQAISANTVVILVGDKDQLPSVDCGQVLEDLIAVDYIPKTILEEIYRQKKESTTLPRALEYNFKEVVPDLSKAKDFEFIEEPIDIPSMIEKLNNLYVEKVKKWGIQNVCLLEPQNKGDIGTTVMNKVLQNTLNPKDSTKKEIHISGEKYIREGDRVIQLRNAPDYNIFNGMVGTVTECYPSATKNKAEDLITVVFDNEVEHIYTRDEFDWLQLAYAMTVHKTQGSEYKCVIMLLTVHHSFMCRKRLVYTGMTRNKEELIILGQKEMIEHSLKNKDIPRNTKLTELLIDLKY